MYVTSIVPLLVPTFRLTLSNPTITTHTTGDVAGLIETELSFLLDALQLPVSQELLSATANGLPFVRYPVRFFLFRRLCFAVECLSGYIRAHEAVIEAHVSYVHLAPAFFPMKERVEQARKHLQELQQDFPRLFQVPVSAITARAKIHLKRASLNNLRSRGLVRETDQHILLHHLDSAVSKLSSLFFHPLVARHFLSDAFYAVPQGATRYLPADR